MVPEAAWTACTRSPVVREDPEDVDSHERADEDKRDLLRQQAADAERAEVAALTCCGGG